MNENGKMGVICFNKKPSLITRAWHRVQERIRHPEIKKKIAGIITLFKGRVGNVRSVKLDELNKNGITTFPGFISVEEVNGLRKSLEELPCFDPWAVDLGEFHHTNIPARTHVAQIKLAPSLVKLHKLAYDRRLADLAAGYFGCKPTLDSIQAWWSVSGHNQPEEAENFHRDNDSIRFLKFFIYITDVGKNNGPHIFVEGSHTSGQLLERRRLTDAEVAEKFGSKILCMTGKAGDAFMEDTYGIHKGQLPIEGRRLLVQFRYSVTETVFRSPITVRCEVGKFSANISSLIHE